MACGAWHCRSCRMCFTIEDHAFLKCGLRKVPTPQTIPTPMTTYDGRQGQQQPAVRAGRAEERPQVAVGGGGGGLDRLGEQLLRRAAGRRCAIGAHGPLSPARLVQGLGHVHARVPLPRHLQLHHPVQEEDVGRHGSALAGRVLALRGAAPVHIAGQACQAGGQSVAQQTALGLGKSMVRPKYGNELLQCLGLQHGQRVTIVEAKRSA